MNRTSLFLNRPHRLFHTTVLILLMGLPLTVTLSPLGVSPALAAPAEGEDEPGFLLAKQSRVVPVALPEGTFRYTGKKEIATYAEALPKLLGTNHGPLGELELLVWRDGETARQAVLELLKKAGYGYEARDALKLDGGQIVPFLCTRPDGEGKVLAMWIEQKENLMLAWARAGGDGASAPAIAPQSAPAAPRGAAEAPGEVISLQLDPGTFYVNVMKGAMPRLPQFPPLSKKAGVVRGYVYDTQGRPLKGAKLGARSTAVGGFYSGSSATTDEKGYYEITAPAGVAHFYCAGYAVEHGEGLAAMGLHPADGSAGNFATPNGEVENFVLLPYGIADRAKAQDDPRAGGNYYGGAVVLGWTIDDDRGIFSSPSYLPNNATIEFTLTPDGPLVDGSRGRPILIRKTISAASPSQLYVNNIPAGPYQVSAKLVGGGPLRLKETGPYANRAFGLEPKQAAGPARLMLRPSTADAGSVPAAYGSWSQISITLERQ